MSGDTPGRPRARAVLAITVVAACAATVAVLAVASPGYAGSSVTATTRTVWVTNSADFLLGRINRQIDELDSAAALSSADFDVLQDRQAVFAVDRSAHQLRRVDPATVTLSEALELPRRAVVALGGGVLAIGDQMSGRVWTLPAADPGTGAVADRPPTATIAPGVVLAVGSRGTVAATAPGQRLLTMIDSARAPGGTGDPRGGDPGSSAGSGDPGGGTHTVPLGRTLTAATDADPSPVSVAMVGGTPVVLDRPADLLAAGERVFPLPHGMADATLQQSGPADDAALVATGSALLRVGLADGRVQTFAAGLTGTPAAPVWLGGCAYAAWSGARPTYLHWCGGEPTTRSIVAAPGRPPVGSLVFRVNGDEIVLNDIATGDAWMLDPAMTVVNNWSQVAPPQDEKSQQPDNAGNEQKSDQVSLSRTNCTGQPSPPVAAPDSFGVRTGRPTLLPVMANDATTDCAAVVIDQVSALPRSAGTVAIVGGGRALQVTAATGATGALPPITYQLADGAGHHSSAAVHITVVPPEAHPKPQRLRGSATMVGVGGTVTDNVLADWYSPAGDPLWLTAAAADGQDLTVGFEPGGAVTVHDTGTGGTGKKTVTFALTDGITVAHGTLSVQVVAAADAAPLASPVYATTPVGRPVTVRPLDFVLNPAADPAVLTAVTADPVSGVPPPALSVAMSAQTGTATVAATAPGDYLLHYQVTAGTLASTGVIRVVVTDGPAPPPVAVTDVGYLAPDGQVRIDLTANDLAPGGALAVQDLQVDPTSPLVVTLSGMHIAHISARRPLPPGGSWFSYTASDGTASATGWVHIVAVAQAPDQGPVASPARMTVRAGDAGTLPIGQVALDRDGNAMTVAPFTPLPADQGLLFAAGDTIRYLAPQRPPGTVSAVYTVTDTAGRSDSAPLHITVVPQGKDNPPADPPATVARVFAGGTVTIPLPLDGIDPDGDWVSVTAVAQQGKLGLARVSPPSAITYTAWSAPGLDTVRYTVTDPFGKRATGSITVLVIPPPAIAQPPVAPDLKVSVAPKRSIGVDVLGAASDPAGLAVRFAPTGAVTVPAGSGVTAGVRDGVLAVTAGAKAGVVPVGYTIVNTRGLSASGVVTVTVSPGAEPVPPTASDIFVTTDMVSKDQRSAVVDVADHVSNPGGLPGDLEITLPTVDPASATKTGPLQATIRLTGGRQVIAYEVRNTDGQHASAFIVVPPDDQLITRVAEDKPAKPDPLTPQVSPLVVDAGKTTSIAIRDYVTGAPAGLALSIPANAKPAADVGTITRQDATHLTWAVPKDAKGGSAVHVDVTDGTSTARVDIPATIKPVIPPAPTFLSTNVTVAAGADTVVQLAPLATPGAPGQHLTFAGPTGAGAGINATRSGTSLRISAAGTARKGTRVDLGVTVSDGVHPPVAATIGVTVVGSTAPPAWIPAIARDGQQGTPLTVNVLAGATNPVPKLGPLKVTAASVIKGKGQVGFDPGGRVTITPGSSQVGALVVQVSVQDATGDPDRVVTGTVTVTVVGRPGQVSGVGVVSTGDRTVNLKWVAPQDNGRPIDHYLVRSTSGGFQQQCPAAATQCRLTGLTNDVTYRFTVTAHNAVGDGPASAASAPATPDVAPDAPAPPSLSFGDGSITATWTPPADRGSPVTGYLVSIAPAPASGAATATVTGTTHTFSKLTNGTSYQVTVVAQNSSGKDSDPSAPATMVPAAPPATPSAPGLAYDGGKDSVTVTWTAPNSNGDDAIAYTVAWKGDDGSAGTVSVAAGKPLAATIADTKLGVTYTATVTARNKAGSSKSSAPGSAKAFVPVGAPTEVKAEATGNDNAVAVTWKAPAYSGWDLSGYQYQVDGAGGWKSLPVADSATISDAGLSNGAAHTVAIRACTQQSAGACGPAAASGKVTPYGPVGTPAVSASGGDKAVSFSWSGPAANGLGPYRYSVNGGSPTSDTSTSVTVACGASASISVVAVDSDGHTGPAATASGTAAACPPPPPSYPTGRAGHAGAPTFASLYNLTPDGNLGPNGSAQIQCWNPARLINSDLGQGWFKLASGPYAGQWSAANNFNDWQSLKSQVAGNSCPKT